MPRPAADRRKHRIREQVRWLFARQLDAHRDTTDDDPQEADGTEKESDRQEELPIATARLCQEEAADERGDQSSDGV